MFYTFFISETSTTVRRLKANPVQQPGQKRCTLLRLRQLVTVKSIFSTHHKAYSVRNKARCCNPSQRICQPAVSTVLYQQSLSIDTNGSTYSVVHIFRPDVSCLNSLLYSYVALMDVTSPFESTTL